ncbi:MAG: hypothetical protein V4722_28120 [Bacteroidota bacterium]
MIQIKPISKLAITSPASGNALVVNGIVWQGLHICANGKDTSSGEEWLVDLPVGQGFVTPMAINKTSKQLYPRDTKPGNWYGDILLKMLEENGQEAIEIKRRGICSHRNIVLLNTVDGWFGHSLLFFFHLEKLKQNLPPDTGLVLVIQPFLEWMIPDYVDECWIPSIPLKKGTNYYSQLSHFINTELERFETVFLSQAPVQSHSVDLFAFTGVKKFDTAHPPAKSLITFIWREDITRLWCKNWLVSGGLKYFKLRKLFLPVHLWRVKRCMAKIQKQLGNEYGYAVAGLGKYGSFGNNIADLRVNGFTREEEVRTCEIYASSALVIGVHGSSMILPSGLAGAVISLMPQKRWGNFAQDILFDPKENLLHEVYNKRMLPLNMPLQEVVDIAVHMVTFKKGFNLRFVEQSTYL